MRSWLKENWGALLFFTVAGLAIVILIEGLVVKQIDRNEMNESCINAGYAGLEYVTGLSRWVCYSTLKDGQFVMVDAERLWSEAQED